MLQISYVLVDEGQRRIRGVFCLYLRHRNTVLRRQVEIERRILRVGRPRGGGCKLRGTEARRRPPARPVISPGNFFSLAIAISFIWSAGPVRRPPSATCSRGS